MFYKSIYKKEDDFEKEIEKLRKSQQEKQKKIDRFLVTRKNEYSYDFTTNFKSIVKKRDNYTCQFPECEIKNDLTVHHVDYNKKNTQKSNCVTLCRRHNLFVNKYEERQIWEEYFNKLLHYKLNR